MMLRAGDSILSVTSIKHYILYSHSQQAPNLHYPSYNLQLQHLQLYFFYTRVTFSRLTFRILSPKFTVSLLRAVFAIPLYRRSDNPGQNYWDKMLTVQTLM